MKRPEISFSEAADYANRFKIALPIILGIRGFGESENQIGVYDDAIVVVDPVYFAAFNANTDPSTQKPGEATLAPGAWSYALGIHGLNKPKDHQYEALVQAAPVTVFREDVGNDTGMFGINIHRGGVNSTGSEGCQTLPPDQWPEFIATVKNMMQVKGLSKITYFLVEWG